MKIKRTVILVLTLISSLGWADRPPRYPDPGNGGGGNSPRPEPRPPGPVRPTPEPNPPYRPSPGNPYDPGYPDYPHRPERPLPPYPGEETQNISFGIYRYVTNERLSIPPLRDLLPYGNYQVESITLTVSNAYNSSVELLVNGVVEDSIISPIQEATLYPAFLIDLNDPYLQMDLGIRGTMYISSITVRLRSLNGIGSY